jgi:nucleotide-binding universal stress UspA family protein
MKTIQKILVPVDFDEASLRAVDGAIDLAATLGASVVLMHAYEVPIVALFPEGPLTSPAVDSARLAENSAGALRALAEARAGRGVPVEIAVREGVPWQQIEEVADEVDADLIVMGTKGRRGILRALFGSVAEHVVRTAHQPVLTIPLSEDGARHG